MTGGEIEWGRAIRVSTCWLLAGSAIAGAALTFQSGSALSEFGAGNVAGSVVVIALARRFGAGSGALAAWMGAVFASDEPQFRFPDVVFFAAVPLSMMAVVLSAAISMTACALAFGVGIGAYWSNVLHYFRAGDAALGLVRACLYSVVLIALARLALPKVRARTKNRIARAALAWLVLALALLPVELVIGLFLPAA